MPRFIGKAVVVTGAGSGIGRELALAAAGRGMSVALSDIQQRPLAETEAMLKDMGVATVAVCADVSRSGDVDWLAKNAWSELGPISIVFNNAGVGGKGGLLWEASPEDWEWTLGANLRGVVNGIRSFVPRMLDEARADDDFRGIIVNTASMAGLVNAPLMGAYNASKHAVVSISETLSHDLALVTDRVTCSVLCPAFVPTGIARSEGTRPAGIGSGDLSKAQALAQSLSDKAVAGGKVTAVQVAELTFNAIGRGDFYIFPHPAAVASVRARNDQLLEGKGPSNPYAAKAGLIESLKGALAT